MKIWLQAYSHGNFGDDLFVYILTKKYINESFYLPCEYTSGTLKKIPNLKILKYSFFDKVLCKLKKNYFPFKRIAKECNVGIVLGGSMFIERRDWRIAVDYYHELTNRINKMFLIGSNFGPYKSEQYRAEFEDVFRKFSDCCFRDQYSKKLFSDLNNVRCAPDVAFSLREETTIKKPNKIVVSVVNLKHKKEAEKYYDQYVSTIRKLCKEFVAKKYDVTLLALCDEQGDSRCCQEIREGLDIELLSYKDELLDVIRLISSAEYVIATRFHAMILGWLYGCKVFPIIYDEKFENVLSDFHWKGEKCTLNSLQNINSAYVINNSYELSDVQKIKIESQKQFAAIDGVLSKKDEIKR